MGRTLKNKRARQLQTARPTVKVANYGMKTKVKRVPQVFPELPPPGISKAQWYANKHLRAVHHRFRAYPPGYFRNEENKIKKEPEPVQYRNVGSFFRPTRKLKKHHEEQEAFHSKDLAELYKK